MKLIDAISDDPNQNLILNLDDGSRVVLDLNYKAGQQGWFMTITYGSFVIRNRRLTTDPNMLRAFRNVLPFGFCCQTSDNQEPINLDDFSTGRANFYILNASDVEYAEGVIAGYAG